MNSNRFSVYLKMSVEIWELKISINKLSEKTGQNIWSDQSEAQKLSKAARGRPEGPTERSVFKIFFDIWANFD